GTRLKGEPTISNYGSQGKSQAQPDGGEGHSVITTGYPVAVLRKAVAPLRQGAAKVRGDEQKSSQACMSGTSLQHWVNGHGCQRAYSYWYYAVPPLAGKCW
ncbi:MAG: hypothetical protein JRE64_23405, partial [Deltaproteobacteria bacterium]|nr:hypothetical protein [Deltaproteobacteria bacterium]